MNWFPKWGCFLECCWTPYSLLHTYAVSYSCLEAIWPVENSERSLMAKHSLFKSTELRPKPFNVRENRRSPYQLTPGYEPIRRHRTLVQG